MVAECSCMLKAVTSRGRPARGSGRQQRQGELDAGGHGCIDLVATVVTMVGVGGRGTDVRALQRVDEVLIGEAFEAVGSKVRRAPAQSRAWTRGSRLLRTR